jgi:hypothetical protein
VPLPGLSTFDASPLTVRTASGGGAATSEGAGIVVVELVDGGAGTSREHPVTSVRQSVKAMAVRVGMGVQRMRLRKVLPSAVSETAEFITICPVAALSPVTRTRHNREMDLQQRAVELARNNSFGPEALDVNLEITRNDPANQGAWTRLARCYLEQRRFADAAGALATVLDLNPSNTIAKSLMTEVTKRRAMALPTVDAASGFTSHDFDALAHLAPVEAARALGSKIETLLMMLNDQRTAGRIVQARTRAGQSGSKLFHRNSYHEAGNGHIHAYHHGGRWEPQFSVGFLAGEQWGGSWVRAGLGFNLSGGDRDDQVDGHEAMVRYFEAFQQQLNGAWGRQLADWMGKTGGFIQYGGRAPAVDLLPPQAIAWLTGVRNAGGQGWIFVGRWLSIARSSDAAIAADMRQLAGAVEDTFAALFPLWASVY